MFIDIRPQENTLPYTDSPVYITLRTVKITERYIGFYCIGVDLNRFGKFFYCMVLVVRKDMLETLKKDFKVLID